MKKILTFFSLIESALLFLWSVLVVALPICCILALSACNIMDTSTDTDQEQYGEHIEIMPLAFVGNVYSLPFSYPDKMRSYSISITVYDFEDRTSKDIFPLGNDMLERFVYLDSIKITEDSEKIPCITINKDLLWDYLRPYQQPIAINLLEQYTIN